MATTSSGAAAVERCVVVSQPMYFPWPGIFEQVRLAQTFVHYDDVQLPQGRSFMTRVQIRTARGPEWLTVPVKRDAKVIRDVRVDDSQDWRRKHLATLAQNYGRAPFFAEMLELARSVIERPTPWLWELNVHSIESVASYFRLSPTFLLSSRLGVAGSSSERLLNLVRNLNGLVYVTGHGAKNYLDHELFERNGIEVRYMNYERAEYPQMHEHFDPHVSILDLVANAGKEGGAFLRSGTLPWKEFTK